MSNITIFLTALFDRHTIVCVCVCVCARARARVCVCVLGGEGRVGGGGVFFSGWVVCFISFFFSFFSLN